MQSRRTHTEIMRESVSRQDVSHSCGYTFDGVFPLRVVCTGEPYLFAYNFKNDD